MRRRWEPATTRRRRSGGRIRRAWRHGSRAGGVPGDLRLARRDPFGLRYVALLVLVIGLAFGSLWRVDSIPDLAPGAGSGAALAHRPAWEGWIEPPPIPGLPSLYLNDQEGVIRVPEGSRVTCALRRGRRARRPRRSPAATRGARGRPRPNRVRNGLATAAAHRRPAAAQLAGRGRRGRAPAGRGAGRGPETTFDGQMSQPFEARDDYGVVRGTAVFRSMPGRVERRHGLAHPARPARADRLDLPMPITGDRRGVHRDADREPVEAPWAHLPVTLELTVEDAAAAEYRAERPSR